MALENTFVQAEMLEATEFPDFVERYNVSGVPQTIIDDGDAHMVGAIPEDDLVAAKKNALR